MANEGGERGGGGRSDELGVRCREWEQSRALMERHGDE